VRNGRRRGADLVEQAQLADAALIEFAGRSQYVTGQLGCIDLVTGTATIVNAGHPPPLRLRDGVVDEIDLHADPPFGALDNTVYTAQRLPLEPGDRIMFITDGLQERGASVVDIRAELETSRGDHPREAVQHLIKAATSASGGKLEDDGTALCLDWHGGPPRLRDAESGAGPVGG
jgi:serine phosphatase RsbU (regulator of sigma subunit)